MEWYRKADGEVVFGEIGARPPGARVVDLMNFATDGDTYVGWAQAVVHGSMQPLERRYNAGGDLQAGPRRRAASPTPRVSTRCWASTASTSRCSTCCRSGRRAATGARR